MQPIKRGLLPRCVGRTKGGINTKLHAVVDGRGQPIMFALTEGQCSDHTGAKLLYPELPDFRNRKTTKHHKAVLIGDKGYDSDEFRQALNAKKISACIPGRSSRKQPVAYDKSLYKQRNLVERMFGRLKDWRRIATRYDRNAEIYLSAITIAATVIFYLKQ